MIFICDLGKKLDGERILDRLKRSVVSGLKVDCLGFCCQIWSLKYFCYLKGV